MKTATIRWYTLAEKRPRKYKKGITYCLVTTSGDIYPTIMEYDGHFWKETWFVEDKHIVAWAYLPKRYEKNCEVEEC